jgi:NADPH:quinone reductase-like Zn-dependent oxidoreductase
MPQVMAIEKFGLASLRAEQRAPEAIGPGLVRVAIRAVSLNHRDVLIMRGTHGAEPLRAPLIPCSDAAGVVLEVGPEVTDLVPGDRVCTHMVPDWREGRLGPTMRATTLGGPAQGVLCEERVLPHTALVRVPSTLSFEHAACLPVAGLAAWSALTTEASIASGQRVLLLGTGGVSMLGLQIASALGAEVALASSSDDKLDRVRRLGASFTANYRNPGWEEQVRGWSGDGVDAVLVAAGDRAFEQSLAATRDGGFIALLAAPGHPVRPASLGEVMLRRIRVHGVFVGSRAELARYVDFVEAHAIEPVIDRVFDGLSSAGAAFAHLSSARHVGKIVVRVSR